MSMIQDGFHDIADSLQAIESKTLIFWRKYVEGVNLTYFECDELRPGCLPPIKPNEVRILGHNKHVEYLEIKRESPNCYYASLVIPIFEILAQRVNATIQLFVSRNESENVDQVLAIKEGVITTIDRVPIIYDYDSKLEGQMCAPPLFLQNQLQILTHRKSTSGSVDNIFSTFSVNIWLVILLYYFVCVGADLYANRRFNYRRISETLINYFKALLSKESQFNSYNRCIFMFWVFGCIPLVEIFRNDMIAKIVEINYREIDNIEELLQTNLSIYAFPFDMTVMKKVTENDDEGLQLRENLVKLFKRSIAFLINDPKWIDVLTDAKLTKNLFENSAFLEDEGAIVYFAIIIGKSMAAHLSKEVYLPQLVTPVCYHTSFAFKNEVNQLTNELFEKGFLSRWTTLKADFLINFRLTLLRLLAGGDVFSKIANDEDQSSENQQMNNLFKYILQMYLIFIVINCSVFVSELIYFYTWDRKRSPKIGMLVADSEPNPCEKQHSQDDNELFAPGCSKTRPKTTVIELV